MDRFLRDKECQELTGGLTRKWRIELERRGKFPPRVQVGPNTVAWLESEIKQWIAERVAERDARLAANPALAAEHETALAAVNSNDALHNWEDQAEEDEAG